MEPERTLLLVDDEENILRSLKRTLRRDGYNILTAVGGEEGLNVLARHAVGVIVSDQRMPGMNGSEFLFQAREHYPDTVRIMLSGYTELSSVTDAINQGAIYKFLTKPWEDDLLRANIGEAFQYHSLRHENKRLTQALTDANKNLEQRVEDRTQELMLSMRVLQNSQDILEGLPCGVIGLDNNGLIANANSYACKFLDKNGNGLLGHDVNNFFPKSLFTALESKSDIPDKTISIEQNEKKLIVNIERLNKSGDNRGVIITFMTVGNKNERTH